MFDGLKRTLGNFSDSVNEEVDDEAAVDSEDETDAGASLGKRAKTLATGKRIIDEDDLDGLLDELQLELLQSNVELDTSDAILDGVREELTGETRTIGSSTGNLIDESIAAALQDVLSANQFDIDARIADADKPVTLLFTGVNGVGKTTTIAKLAKYFGEQGYSCVIANGDTYRAGANQQIADHAEALDVKLIMHDQGGDPAAVLYDAVEYAEANDVDIVLGDTAGRLHTDSGLMEQLRKIDRVVNPDFTLFVDEAVAGQDAVNRAREFGEAADADGAILTMAEADDTGGAAVSISYATGLPVLFLGVGQEYDDLIRFDPDDLSAAIAGIDTQ